MMNGWNGYYRQQKRYRELQFVRTRENSIRPGMGKSRCRIRGRFDVTQKWSASGGELTPEAKEVS